MRHVTAARTDIGRVREHNEDALLADTALGLYLVCDGCGGHAAGEVASATSCAEIQGSLAEHGEELVQWIDDAAGRERVARLAVAAIRAANQRVYEMAAQDIAKRGMACTAVLALTVGNHALIAHVGDSRAYLLREGQVTQLTDDHNLGVELFRSGTITEQQINDSGAHATLTRAVGPQLDVEPETVLIELMSGDRLVLCSDGIMLNVTNDELPELMAHTPSTEVPDVLIDLTNARGGEDNSSVIVIEVRDDDPSRGS